MSSIAKPRVDWVDYSKGICIILVVMMHSTLGVEKATGTVTWLNGFIEWARPFRMPDFFMISGLFLAARIDRPWRSYLDTKVLHFAYLYILWMTIQFAAKGYGIVQEGGTLGLIQSYLMGYVQPFGTLWFIYMLAVFFVVTKLLRGVPPAFVFAAAMVIEMAPIATGWVLVDEFAGRYVYFFTGFWLAQAIFDYAAGVARRPILSVVSGLAIWGMVNGWLVHHSWATLPGIGLVLGFCGAAAIVATGVILARTRLAEPIRYCGENSIVIYLAFFLFMAATRAILLKAVPGMDLGVTSLVVTAAGVIGPVLLFWATRTTRFSFLFRRPKAVALASADARWHSARHVKIAQSTAR